MPRRIPLSNESNINVGLDPNRSRRHSKLPGQLIPIPIALPPLEVFYDQFTEKEENFSLVYNALHNTLEV